MPFQTVFKRHELKFMLTKEQKQLLVSELEKYMKLDKYGKTNIRNLYFDTDNFLLIRRSIEKPVYKEKLRIRSYGRAGDDTPVFVELKKKYKGVVYKRRISLPSSDAVNWLSKGKKPADTQISREIDYFIKYYKNLHPTVFLSYDREAYFSRDGSDFRVTFDENIICRQTDLSLNTEASGYQILDGNKTLMEIKCSGGIPLWMTELLSKEKIYKTSFSKYGTAYKTLILPHLDRFNRNTIQEATINA